MHHSFESTFTSDEKKACQSHKLKCQQSSGTSGCRLTLYHIEVQEPTGLWSFINPSPSLPTTHSLSFITALCDKARNTQTKIKCIIF